ncbi:hypothetical protein ABMA32_15920 [Mesorhizobium sp. VNQ89]|uniref:hypothetical protein n=1 Tax=Mesorhizobium quangtriensis TaxID=3157709 RepID=UPI0032B71AC8
MKLPSVDQFREPFVLPIGHLAMQAAYADEQLALLCAAASEEGENPLSPEETAHKMRNWDDNSKRFAFDLVSGIGQPEIRASALVALQEYGDLRELRHRAIHDSISLGLYGDAEAGYEARPLAVEFRRGRETTTQHLRETTPDHVAAVACRFEEVQKTFEFITYHLRDSRAENRPLDAT